MITAIFLAVALMAVCRPFRNAIFLKNFAKSESLRFPTALAAFLNAVFRRLHPLGILFESVLPPLILLLGASLNQEAKCLAVGNLLNPSGPISLIKVRTVE